MNETNILEKYQLNLDKDVSEMTLKLWNLLMSHLLNAEALSVPRGHNHHLNMANVVLNTMVSNGYLITRREKNLNILLNDTNY